MRRALVALALVVAGCGGAGAERDEPRTSPAQGRADRGGDPDRHLRALARIARRSGGTRAAGTDGDRPTVEYIARTLRAAGWTVREQRFSVPYFDQRAAPRLAGLRAGRQVRAAEYSGAGRVRARVQRARGRGCSPRDFAGVARGGIALVDRGTCLFRVKARNAERAGAGAIVIADTPGGTPVAATLVRPGIGIPVLIVTQPGARRIEGRTVDLRVDAVSERRSTANVIAQTRSRRGRWMMAGAHHDSVTAGPGLNDNGSGVAALLALAERVGGDVPGLRLGFWAAEESGLYGSRRYVGRLSAAQRRAIAGYVNLDMVGSPNARVAVYAGGGRIEGALRRALPGPEGEMDLEGSSDHAPFARAGIPVGGIFTSERGRGRRTRPADRCYHRACDTLRNVDRRLVRRMSRAAERALVALSR